MWGKEFILLDYVGVMYQQLLTSLRKENPLWLNLEEQSSSWLIALLLEKSNNLALVGCTSISPRVHVVLFDSNAVCKLLGKQLLLSLLAELLAEMCGFGERKHVECQHRQVKKPCISETCDITYYQCNTANDPSQITGISYLSGVLSESWLNVRRHPLWAMNHWQGGEVTAAVTQTPVAVILMLCLIWIKGSSEMLRFGPERWKWYSRDRTPDQNKSGASLAIRPVRGFWKWHRGYRHTVASKGQTEAH